MIVEKILEAKKAKIKQWPVNANRASELGHECLRYLVLNRTRWQEKGLYDARLQMIFDMGKAVEDMVCQDLKEAGFTIVEQQRPFSWPQYQITGSIDFKLAIDGQTYPAEIKSAAPHPFASINSVEDMLKHKYPYMRRYPAQLTLYLLMDGKEKGLFLFKNKSSGELKEIWMDLDYEFAESLVQKAEVINNHVAGGTLPEPIEYQDDICGECAFAHICLPERIGKEGRKYVRENFLLPDRIADYLMAIYMTIYGSVDKKIYNECVVSFRPWFRKDKLRWGRKTYFALS